MSAFDWKQEFSMLAESFAPLSLADPDDYANLASALDDNVDKLLAVAGAAGGSPSNRRYVEQLLSDCVARISNCLILREKASDIEIRAIGEAAGHKMQSQLLKSNIAIGELLAPIQAQLASNATRLTPLEGGYAFKGDEKIWENIKIQQNEVWKTQKELLNLTVAKANTPGNGSNYLERFTMLKRLFDLGITEVYGRCLVCASALKKIYGIDLPVPEVMPVGYLNALALWGQTASDRLDVELGIRYSADIAFALGGVDENLKSSEIMERSKFSASVTTGVFNFSVSNKHLERFKMLEPRLRSVRLQLRPKTEEARIKVWSGVLQLPGSDLTPGDESFPCTISSSYSDSENEAIHGVHNLNPIGDWTLRLPERGVTGDPIDEIVNIYLRMRVSYKRGDM